MELRTVQLFGSLLLLWSVECHLLAHLFSHLDPNLAFLLLDLHSAFHLTSKLSSAAVL